MDAMAIHLPESPRSAEIATGSRCAKSAEVEEQDFTASHFTTNSVTVEGHDGVRATESTCHGNEGVTGSSASFFSIE